jgi:hypothetical protein
MHMRYIGYLASVRGGHIVARILHWRGSGGVPGGQKEIGGHVRMTLIVKSVVKCSMEKGHATG